jgi:hypothetical protein
MQDILNILEETNETKIEKFIDVFLSNENDYIVDYLENLTKKIGSIKSDKFEKIIRYFSQNLCKNNKEYSLFMIPVIKNFIDDQPLKSVEVMEILLNYTLDNEDIVLIDNWVSYQDILQEPSVFRGILKDVASNTINGPTYLELNNMGLTDYNKPTKKDFFNYDTYHFIHSTEKPEEKIISLKFIVGVIVRPKRKKINVMDDIIERKNDSKYIDTGLHGILLSEHYNYKDNKDFIYEKEKNNLLYSIHALDESNILMVCEPGNPLDIVQAVTQYESLVLIQRITYYKTLYKKVLANLVYNETDNILYIMFFGERHNSNNVLILFDTMELICNPSILEIYCSVLDNFISIQLSDTHNEIFNMYEKFLKTIH